MIYILILSALTFTIITAICEAAYFHLRNITHIKQDFEHWYLNAMRICFLLAIYAAYPSLVFALGLACCFPFIHDGVYYIARHSLDKNVYGSGFLDSSFTSTAWVEIADPFIRIALFIAGITLMVIAEPALPLLAR